MGHDDEVPAGEVHDDVLDDEVAVDDVADDDESHMTTPPLDVAAANAALPGDEQLTEREAAGTDEWTRLDDGAGITSPHTHSNWRVT